jgi:hypothetical protein
MSILFESIDLSRLTGGQIALPGDVPDTSLAGRLDASPQPGDFALRCAPERVDYCPANFDSLPDFGRTNADGFVHSDAWTSIIYLSNANFWVSLLNAARAARARPRKTGLARAIGAVFKTPFVRRSGFHWELSANQTVVHLSVREYYRELLRELVSSRRLIAECFARARSSLIRPKARPVTETGSAAAIARRMTPLGAPPQFA